jgi:hypothetical protein
LGEFADTAVTRHSFWYAPAVVWANLPSLLTLPPPSTTPGYEPAAVSVKLPPLLTLLTPPRTKLLVRLHRERALGQDMLTMLAGYRHMVDEHLTAVGKSIGEDQTRDGVQSIVAGSTKPCSS